MGLFRRRRRGRHALGAAVTEIPSGPVAVPVAPPVAGPPAEPDLLTSIAQLIATGEAWNEPVVGGRRTAEALDAPWPTRTASLEEALSGQPVTATQPALDVAGGPADLVDSARHEPQPAVHLDLLTWAGEPDVAVEPPSGPPLPAVDAVPANDAATPLDGVAGPPQDVEPGAGSAPVLVAPGRSSAGSQAFAAEPPTPSVPAPAPEPLSGVEVPRAQASPGPVEPSRSAELSLASEASDAALRPTPPAPSGSTDAGETRLLSPPLESLAASLPAAATSFPLQGGPRVELGFRDGTTAALDPDSEQALALAELSEMLNARD